MLLWFLLLPYLQKCRQGLKIKLSQKLIYFIVAFLSLQISLWLVKLSWIKTFGNPNILSVWRFCFFFNLCLSKRDKNYRLQNSIVLCTYCVIKVYLYFKLYLRRPAVYYFFFSLNCCYPRCTKISEGF